MTPLTNPKVLVALLAGGPLIACNLMACNAFDEPNAGESRQVRLVPVDERPAVQSDVKALPVSGGTLLALDNGGGVIASDPSRDLISVSDGNTVTNIELADGTEPGRMTHLGGAAFAVVLRGTGEIATYGGLDAGEPTEGWRTKVCKAPRGLDFELPTSRVHVACAEGKLVSLDATTGEVVEQFTLPTDVRDVVAADGRLYVSRFRSAEVLFVENGEVTKTVTLPTVRTSQSAGSEVTQRMQPTVAWRMQRAPGGGVLVVHQRASLDEVAVDPPEADDENGNESGSPYGGSGGSLDCAGIVQSGVTMVTAEGARLTTNSLSGTVLPVDLAVSPNGAQFAVANAGPADREVPQSTVATIFGSEGPVPQGTPSLLSNPSVSLFSMSAFMPVPESGELLVGCEGGVALDQDQPATAVAFSGSDVVAQRFAQAKLTHFQPSGVAETPLSDVVIDDTGHELFHRDTGGGLACAACHPEGTDDGHVWTFTGLGPRRTQNLAVPLAETAPFHWDGDLPNVSSLMDEVFVERMGGAFQSQPRLDVLQHWLFTAPETLKVSDLDASAERGKELFESVEVGCASCHTGGALTDNESYDVGTAAGKRLQVPSLVGIGAHPPYMHDGCAKTLRERFDDEACGGGDAHGRTSQLETGQVDDLVAYMRTL